MPPVYCLTSPLCTVTEGGEDEKADADLKQGDYEKALGNEESDPLYSKFLSRVRLGGDKQVLRYFCGPRTADEDDDQNKDEDEDVDKKEVERAGDSMPLAVSSSGYIDVSAIPPCEHCHAPRVFEFQVRTMYSWLFVDLVSRGLFKLTTYTHIDTCMHAHIHSYIQPNYPLSN